MSELVEVIARDFGALGDKVTLVAKCPCFRMVQPNLPRRAIRNLVDNAIKYAGSAELVVACGQEGVSITVLDRGPGVRVEEIDRVSGAFYRGEPSRNRDTGGAGLGLSIAESIVEALGGTLSLANRDVGGLAATLSLPAAQKKEGDPEGPPC